MFDKTENSVSVDFQAGIDAFVRVGNFVDNATHGSPIPYDPRVKCIQWSTSELLKNSCLKIVSMTGDFSAFGVNAETPESQQQQVFELLQETYLQEAQNQFETTIRDGRSPEKIELKLCSGEDVFWVEQETVVLNTPTDELQIFSYWYDITAQKLADKDLRILRQVVDGIPSWIFLKNSNHQYELVNKAYAAVYGVSPAECIGKTCVELGVPRAIAENFWKDDLEVFESGTSKDIYAEPIIIAGQKKISQHAQVASQRFRNEARVVDWLLS